MAFFLTQWGLAWGDEIISEEEQERYAAWLINRRGDDPEYIYRTNRPFDHLDREFDFVDVSDANWDFACDLSQEEWAIGIGNRRMFDDVQLRLVQEAEAGNVTFGHRPVFGGEPQAMPRDWWFTDRYASRFENIAINSQDPFLKVNEKQVIAEQFSSSSTQSDNHHIFARSDDVASLLNRLSTSTPKRSAPNPIGNFSPYLQLMLEVHDYMKIEPSAQPKKSEIMSVIQSRWSEYNLPASANLLNAMATLLRDAESQAGRARKP